MDYDICVECERENQQMLKKKGYCLSHTLPYSAKVKTPGGSSNFWTLWKPR
jgi:hypothetical protein